MPATYYIYAPVKTVEHLLGKVIEAHSEDTISTHLSNIFLSKDNDKLSGYCRNKHFKLWFSSLDYTRAFYPVLYGEMIDNGDKTIIKIGGKLNPVALVLILPICISLIVYFVYPYISDGPSALTEIWRRGFLSLVILLMANCPIILCYYITRGAIIKELKEKIGLKTL